MQRQALRVALLKKRRANAISSADRSRRGCCRVVAPSGTPGAETTRALSSLSPLFSPIAPPASVYTMCGELPHGAARVPPQSWGDVGRKGAQSTARRGAYARLLPPRVVPVCPTRPWGAAYRTVGLSARPTRCTRGASVCARPTEGSRSHHCDVLLRFGVFRWPQLSQGYNSHYVHRKNEIYLPFKRVGLGKETVLLASCSLV